MSSVLGSEILKFAAGFKAIAQHVRIPRVSGEKDEEGLLRRVRRWLEVPDSSDWILVIDNADNDADFIGNTSPISKFVPQGRKWTVMFTTRSRQVAIRQGCKIIKVGQMEPEEALELFSKRFDSWHGLEDGEKRAVAMILNSVDHLPLAVVGSSAFMTENGTSPSVYWSIFQENYKRARELLLERFCDIQREVDMTESILSTYFITPDRTREQRPLAANLLGLIAFFDRQNIPEELLTRNSAPLSRKAHEAEVVCFKVLRDLEKASGLDHPNTLLAVNNLAVVLRGLGRYKESEAVNRRALEGYEKGFGLDHPKTLMAVNNLAVVLWEQGRYEESEMMNRRALEGCEKGLGSDHPNTLVTVNNLALVLREQGRCELGCGAAGARECTVYIDNLTLALVARGKYAEAETLLRALTARESALCPEHSKVCEILQRLACLHEKHGQYPQAEEAYERAYKGFSKAFGEQHLTTLECITRLKLLREQQPSPERTSQVEVEQSTVVANHQRSPGDRAFSWLKRH
ncbi:TPR-like protein [Tuber magnatum]|uniref:TPR-like protein n=1 Tax=Tuber magnatum TaxID=42249 RepID=A0A317T2K5_9PEZI|nr:TPR-like protein [Tuber magnatum]